MKKHVFIILFLTLSTVTIGQTYHSFVQHSQTPDGTKKMGYHLTTVILSKENTSLKIIYDDFTDQPMIFTLEKINTIELSKNRGTTVQYRTLPDSHYSFINFNIVLITTYRENIALDEKRSYNYEVAIIQQRSDESIEVCERYLIFKR